MAKKFTLNPNPTFKAKVGIPIPGGNPHPVEFTFKHRNKEAFKAFMESLQPEDGQDPRPDAEIVMDVASGWDLDEPFDAENVGTLVTEYIGAARAVLDKYVTELVSAKLGN